MTFNFDRLNGLDSQLAEFGGLAEGDLKNGQTKGCLFYSRCFGEHMAELVRKHEGLGFVEDETYADKIGRLKGCLARAQIDDFYLNKGLGNKIHEHGRAPSKQDAARALESARRLGSWYHSQYGSSGSFGGFLKFAFWAAVIVIGMVAVRNVSPSSFQIGNGYNRNAYMTQACPGVVHELVLEPRWILINPNACRITWSTDEGTVLLGEPNNYVRHTAGESYYYGDVQHVRMIYARAQSGEARLRYILCPPGVPDWVCRL